MHSDIKPANFLVVEGQLKLIDFGIAKAIQSGVCLTTVGGRGGRRAALMATMHV